MADITVTAANVLKGSNAQTFEGVAGATITAGDVCYKDTADSNKYKLAINSAEASSAGVAIALCGAATGQPVVLQRSGDINPGGTVVVAEVYCVSPVAGGIAPDADVASGDFRTVLGVGITATNIAMDIQVSGVAVP